jgi:hypothetical protein
MSKNAGEGMNKLKNGMVMNSEFFQDEYYQNIALDDE